MTNVTKKVMVYTRDGRSFEMDEYMSNLNRGVKVERYSNGKTIQRQYNFNGDFVVCHEHIIIEEDISKTFDNDTIDRKDDSKLKQFYNDVTGMSESK